MKTNNKKANKKQDLKTAIKKSSVKKYIITSCQFNSLLNHQMIKNIETFCNDKGVEKKYVFMQKGKYKDEDLIPPKIWDYGFEPINKSITLNKSLRLFDTLIPPQQIRPFTGLSNKLSRDYSYILPSPKIRYISLANNSKHPRALMSTGNISHGNYKSHTAHGRKADEQHQYGFVYVEIVNNKVFNAYQIETTKTGSFEFMGKEYKSGKVGSKQVEALVLGDWHIGDTNPKVKKATMAILDKIQPKRVVFHDLFNGHSINHHEEGSLITSIRNYQEKRDNLSKELKLVYKEVHEFADRYPNIEFVVSESNHDLFLYRYIDEKKFVNDAENFLLCCKVVNDLINWDKCVLEIALSKIGPLPANFNFLKEDESYRVRGVEIGYHGHRGVNGSRGTSSSFDKNNLKMITAHEHSPKLYANGMVVGTSTYLKLPYTKGAGSWLNAHGVLYSNGKYHLLPMII